MDELAALKSRLSELSEELQRRRQIERELWEQRESLRVTLASIGDAVIVTDVQGRVQFLNPIAEQLTGWSQAEAAGKPLETVFWIVNETTRAHAENPVRRVLEEGQIVGLANHTILIAKDGTERAIDDSAAPIIDQDGKLSGVVLVFRDVTEARRAALARARLAALVESSQDAIIGMTFEGVVTDWNRAAETLFGLTSAETIGHPLTSLIVPPDRVEELHQALRRIEQGQRVEVYETIRCHRDGRRIPISIRMSPVRDDEGNLVGASAIDRDISEQKHNETALRFLADASHSLSSLVDYRSTLQKIARLAVPGFADWCAVDLVDADGNLERVAVAHVDPAKVELAHELFLRYPPDPQAAYGVTYVVRTGQADMRSEITSEFLADPAHDPERMRMVERLGLRSYICVPLSAGHRIVGVLTFVTAESGRRFNRSDQALAEDLAGRAVVAMENARLYTQLQEADRRKDEFLAMLAHELRNPLAPIRSGLDVLAMDAEGQHEVLDLMKHQVDHLVRLVDDLLDVSRIMWGRIELRRQAVELKSVIERSLQAVRGTLREHQHELVVSVAEEPVWLRADPVRLIQILENLLNNACKYTPSGGRIELAARRHEGEVVLDVVDSGIGIEPELLPSVFDLFSQSSRALDRSQGGLGIGLTLVKNLVELHGGAVSAHSEGSGRGSRFTVRLPVGTAVEEETPAETLAVSVESLRILIVDDNVAAARMLAILLGKLQAHRVEIAHEGPAALDRMERFQPQVVLLDIGLPHMDGYEVARRIRAHPQLSEVLLVALTGYGQAEDRRRSQEAGFDEHLVKPPSLLEVERVLARAAPAAAQEPSISAGAEEARSEDIAPGEKFAPLAFEPALPSPRSEERPTRSSGDEHEGLLRQLSHDLGNLSHLLSLAVHVVANEGSDLRRESIIELLESMLPTVNSLSEMVEQARRGQ